MYLGLRDYVDGTHHWFEETNHSSGTGVDPHESESEYQSYRNPTDFMVRETRLTQWWHMDRIWQELMKQ